MEVTNPYEHKSIENSDVVCIINPEVKSDTGELFLTFKLLKRRYRSAEEDEKLRRLEYFNHPFEAGNEIKLIDDIDSAESISATSIASRFEPAEPKRGKTNVVDREDKTKKNKKNNDEFEPFDFSKATNF